MDIKSLLKILAAMFAAIFAVFAANKLVEKKTGRGITAHAYRWYTSAREDVLAWAREQDRQEIISVTVWVDHRSSDLMRLVYRGATREQEVEITETTVSLEEALEMYPELAESDAVDITELTLET